MLRQPHKFVKETQTIRRQQQSHESDGHLFKETTPLNGDPKVDKWLIKKFKD